MTVMLWLGGGISAALLVYLMFALLFPEKL